MKKYFVTGLVILLPLALTLAIVVFVFNFLTEPFVGIIQSILAHYNLLETGFLFMSPEQVQHFASQVIIFFLLFSFTTALGAFARRVFVHYLLRLSDYIFQSIPFISAVYKTCKDVIKTIFTSNTNSFKQVVLVPFPYADTYSIGLVTREDLPGVVEDSEKSIAVFVPTTPNPTSGFLMLFREEDLLYIDMPIEEAFKYVISCGVILPPFKTIKKKNATSQTSSENPESEIVEPEICGEEALFEEIQINNSDKI